LVFSKDQETQKNNKKKKKPSNNRFNLTIPLSRFVQHYLSLRSLVLEAQTAPSPTGTEVQVKRMLA